MLSRSSQAAADLLGCQPLPICRKCMLSPALRRHNVFLRSVSQSGPEDIKRQFEIRRNRLIHKKILKDYKSTKVPISVSSLGEPAEVLLVKDRERRQFPGRVKGGKSAGQSSLSLMLDEVEASEALVDEDLVSKNLEFLRRYKPGDKLSLDEWRDHRREIWKSLTNKQMSVYISEFLSNEGEESPEQGTEVSAKWRPGISTFLDSANVHDSKRVTRSQENAKVKDILVERIMRDCWKLGILGETGQLDYQLSPPLLSLLAQSANFSFEVLASLHDAQVDLTHSLGLVRITGSQKACEALRDVVHDATPRLRQEDIQLHPQDDPKAKAVNRIFNSEFLSWVSKTYGVVFEQHASQPIKLFYLAENKQGADDARRTLNLAIHDTYAPQASFGTYVSASEPMEYHDFSPENNTTWWNREKPWFRWAVPPAQSAVAKALETPFFNNHETRLSDELLKLLRKSHPKIDGDDHAEVRETVSAAVGRCLFLRKPSLVDEKISANQLGKLAASRIFSTDIPQVASILRMLSVLTTFNETQQHHRIQLVPSVKHANIFPALNVEFTVKKDHNPDCPTIEVLLKSAKTILSKNKVDYLLPENGLDLRFTRTLTRELMGQPSQNVLMQNLQQLLHDVFSKARANREDKPLPAFINLSLPNNALLSGSTDMDPSGETTAEYMFLPVNDIRGTRIHPYDFLGHGLTYSYYESGPYYSHRMTDLFLDIEMTEGSSDPVTKIPRDFNSFYKAACALAFDVDKAWRARSTDSNGTY